ncbi:MAG TPA: alcohol dehydrogenase catalytic domain-containing protein [Chloroflexota bacterium]
MTHPAPLATAPLESTNRQLTYRRSVIAAPRQIEFQDVALAEPGPRQVLVRVSAAALCTWEQRVYAGVDASSYPLVGGHEFAGDVVAVGAGVAENLQPGDQVAVAGLRRCGECWACRRGYDNICDNQHHATREPGRPWGPGGFGQYVLVDSYQVFRFPRRVSAFEAALAEPLACVLHDVKRFSARRGDTAVIVGAGIMGLLHLAVLRSSGASIVVSEPDPTRRAKALEMGAHAAIDPTAENYVEAVQRLTNGRGASVTYMAIGMPAAIELAVQAAAKRGIVSVYASINPRGQTIQVDPNVFHHKEVILSGSLAQDHEDFLDSVWSIAHGTIDLKPVLSGAFALEDLDQAFAAASRPDTYRVFVTPNGAPDA